MASNAPVYLLREYLSAAKPIAATATHILVPRCLCSVRAAHLL
jgi:hypothetical protein